MKITKHCIDFCPGVDPFIFIHGNGCYCSNPTCGATKPRTTGFTIRVWKYLYTLTFDTPRNCCLPF